MSNKFSPNSKIGIQPSPSEFGNYAEFIIFPETLPRLYRDNNVEDFLDFVRQDNHFGMKNDFFGSKKPILMQLKYIFQLIFFLPILAKVMRLTYFLEENYYRIGGYNKGKAWLPDFLPRIPGLIGMFLGVYAIFYFTFVFVIDATDAVDLEVIAAMGYFVIHTIFILPYGENNPKVKYLEWCKTNNGDLLDGFVVSSSDNFRTREHSRIIQDAVNYLRIKSSKNEISFSTSSSGKYSEITENDRYILSINRIKYIWGNENNKNHYTQ